MNANATTAIRELTAQELDQVTGGFRINSQETEYMVLFTTVFTGLVSLGACLLDWLFG